MKDPQGRKESEVTPPLSSISSEEEGSPVFRVDYRKKSLVANQQMIRQLSARRPAARSTFRVTVG